MELKLHSMLVLIFLSHLVVQVMAVGMSCKKSKYWGKHSCLCDPENSERISRFRSSYSNHYEDRKWTLTCGKGPHYPPMTGKWYKKEKPNRYDGKQLWDGRKTNSFLVGMQSWYDKKWPFGSKDRSYELFTTKMSSRILINCKDWEKMSRYESSFDHILSIREVIAGVKSYHSNKWEDREFHIIVCDLVPTNTECDELVNIDYEKEKTIFVQDDVIARERIFDNADSPETNQFEVKLGKSETEAFSQTYSFTRTSGSSISNTLSVKTGLNWGVELARPPFVAASVGGSLEIDTGFEQTFSTTETWTKSNTKSYSETNSEIETYKATCPAYCLCTMQIIITRGTMEVPYSMDSLNSVNKRTCNSKGVLNVSKSSTGTQKISSICKNGPDPGLQSPNPVPNVWNGQCVLDSSDRVLPYNGGRTNDRTPTNCVKLCRQKYYKYAGVQDRGECYCGNTAPKSTTSSAECNFPCTGDSNKKCGGAWRLSVYSTGCMKKDVNTLGGVFRHLVVESVDHCSMQCNSLPECKAWTYRSSSKTCWLKYEDIGEANYRGLWSGTKVCPEGCMKKGVNSLGGTIKHLKVGSVYNCEIICNNLRACKAWTFYPPTGQCWIKHNDLGEQPYSSMWSGKKFCSRGPQWRTDSRCGSNFPLSDGRPSKCNPKWSARPCCSGAGWCGNTDNHCKCQECTDFRTNTDEDEDYSYEVDYEDIYQDNGGNGSASDEGCVQINYRYLPIDDIPGQGRTETTNYLYCQIRCIEEPDCSYFSFWADGGCHLSSAAATLSPWQGVMAGNWQCSFSGCGLKNTRHSPMDDIVGQGRTEESDAQACQDRCAQVTTCSFFSFWADGGCHLSSAAGKIYPKKGVTSGPPSC